MTTVPVWDDLYTEEELRIRRAGGYAARVGMGRRPAIMAIDITYNFTGDRGDDHLASVAKFFTSCGPLAWKAIPHIQRLLATGRELGIPVIYTRSQPVPDRVRGSLRRKHARSVGDTPEARARGNDFTKEIAPVPGDIVVEKTKASAFFGTPLLGHLQMLGVDHLVFAGTSTSGCVRASVVDASANNFGVTVVADCVFDRFPTSHKATLFDLDSKYADVVTIDEAVSQLREVGAASASQRETPAD
jgi:nicotinamidase-related amidase